MTTTTKQPLPTRDLAAELEAMTARADRLERELGMVTAERNLARDARDIAILQTQAAVFRNQKLMAQLLEAKAELIPVADFYGAVIEHVRIAEDKVDDQLQLAEAALQDNVAAGDADRTGALCEARVVAWRKAACLLDDCHNALIELKGWTGDEGKAPSLYVARDDVDQDRAGVAALCRSILVHCTNGYEAQRSVARAFLDAIETHAQKLPPVDL